VLQNLLAENTDAQVGGDPTTSESSLASGDVTQDESRSDPTPSALSLMNSVVPSSGPDPENQDLTLSYPSREQLRNRLDSEATEDMSGPNPAVGDTTSTGPNEKQTISFNGISFTGTSSEANSVRGGLTSSGLPKTDEDTAAGCAVREFAGNGKTSRGKNSDPEVQSAEGPRRASRLRKNVKPPDRLM
jgi:hypothetical protein